MRRTVFLAIALALSILVAPWPSLRVEAAAELFLQQRCEPDGTVSLAFVWEGHDPQARQLWIDVSGNGTWQPGTFTAAGPVTPSQGVYIWTGWRPATTYYARVNQQLADGTWDASIMYRVEIQSCGGPPAQSTPANPPAQVPATPQQPAPQQPQSQTPATPGGTRIASLTSPVGRGKDATATVQTQPNASCTISYTPPSGTSPAAEALGPKTADATGTVIWTWRIGSSTDTGNGAVSVTCAGQTATATLIVIQG